MTLCPCGSEKDYSACCEPLITGSQAAETAEALMRARQMLAGQPAFEQDIYTVSLSSTLTQQLRERGIGVTVFTNSFASTDVQVVHSAYQKYREQLLAMGVEIYELKQLQRRLRIMEKLRKYRKERNRAGSRASLHAKVIVYDRKRLYIGSMNADPRSIHHNTEMGLLIALWKPGKQHLEMLAAHSFPEDLLDTFEKIPLKSTCPSPRLRNRPARSTQDW